MDELLLLLVIFGNLLVLLSQDFDDFVLQGLVSVQPLILLQRLEGGSLLNLGAEKGVEQPLEGVGVEPLWLLLLVQGPELAKVFALDQVVNSVGFLGAHEGGSAGVHHKQDHSCRK